MTLKEMSCHLSSLVKSHDEFYSSVSESAILFSPFLPACPHMMPSTSTTFPINIVSPNQTKPMLSQLGDVVSG
jgi:hypothetical protein